MHTALALAMHNEECIMHHCHPDCLPDPQGHAFGMLTSTACHATHDNMINGAQSRKGLRVVLKKDCGGSRCCWQSDGFRPAPSSLRVMDNPGRGFR